jgi:hypothetical protein
LTPFHVSRDEFMDMF